MKKMLLTLAAAGVLAAPVGVIVAEEDSIEPADPVPASVEPERDRDRDCRHVEDETVNGGAEVQDRVGDCDGAQARVREQHRLEDGTGEGPMVRVREQYRLEDGTGEGPMAQNCERVRVEDGIDDPVPEESTGDPAATDVDDGANLQFRYGADSGRGDR